MASTAPPLRHSCHLYRTNINYSSLFSFTHRYSTITFRHFRKHLLSLSSSSSSSLLTRVSTAPVEYAPPAPEFDFDTEIARLKSSKVKLSNATSLELKHRVIDCDSRVSWFVDSTVARVLESVQLSSFEEYLIKCVIAAGQEHVISYGVVVEESDHEKSSRSLLKSALLSLAEMIESWDMVWGGAGNGRVWTRKLVEEEISAFKKLLKTLAELERFYDCIGGIIG